MDLDLEQLPWSVAEGATDEYEFQIRFRKFPESINTKAYPIRLNIFWQMDECFENGYPTEEELKRVHTFENRIVDAVEHDNFSIMSIVLTGNGQREFVFHTSDSHEFIDRLTNMPQEDDPYPLEIHSNDDEEWEYYFDELNQIEGLA